MALELAATIEGLAAPQAYHRIRHVGIYSEAGQVDAIDLVVETYATEQARLDGHRPLKEQTVPLRGEAAQAYIDQFKPAAYRYLKALPEFQSAEDV